MNANDSREADSSTIGESKDVNETKMQQPPVVILPLIFSKLAFKDIKSCRLVNKQWHRHALGRVNLVLCVEGHGPTRTRQWIPERHGIYSPREVIGLDRFHCRLVPLTEILRYHLNKLWMPKQPEPKFFFNEINDGVNSFKQRIKQIDLEFKDINERMHPVLQTFMANFPAAKVIDGRCNEVDVDCTFEEDKSAAGLDNRAAAMKLRTLHLRGEIAAEDVTATAPIIAPFLQQAANEAASINIHAIQQVQSLLNELERNSDEAPIIFDACNNVSLEFKQEADQFDINRFPNIEEAHITDWTVPANANFMASLEQTPNLKRLTIACWADELLQLPSLRLPNLVRLALGRTNLPDNPLQFASPGLEELEAEGGENLRRLANYARSGGCKSLKTLKLNWIDSDSVSRHLPAVLKAAKGLQTLIINRGKGFELIAETCIAMAAATPRNLVELKCVSDHEVPIEVGAKQFLRELVAWHQLVGLKTPLVLQCRTREGSQLANGLKELLQQSKEIDVDGTLVTLAVLKSRYSTEINFDMAWRSNVNGTLQILRPRIGIWPDYGDDE